MIKIGLFIMSMIIVFSLTGCQMATGVESFDDQRQGLIDETLQEKGLFDRRLPIPPLLEDRNPSSDIAEYYIDVERGSTEIIKGFETETLGYNGSILGPTIQSHTGEEVIIHVTNGLDELTTVHWHGLIVPGEMDGGPHQIIGVGETWSPEFILDQPALTAWYHPHLMGTTAIQVYQGLAGMWIHDDDLDLGLPETYGEDDLPIVVQDRAFTEIGSLYYNSNMMNGAVGNYIMINGQVGSYKEVPSSWVRLRLLNGSNSAQHEMSFRDGTTFYQIASDGGLLEEPVEMTSIKLAPGERAEILVNFKDYESGQGEVFVVSGINTIEFIANGTRTNEYELEKNLASIEHWDQEDVTMERSFDLEGMAHMVSINGQLFDMTQISFEVPIDKLEKWLVTNVSGSTGGMGMMMSGTPHSFHVHGLQFQVISRDSGTPPPGESGWKDTVYLLPGEQVELLVKFSLEGVFMYHCHNLEHEDAGMMGQFQVISSGVSD